MNDNTIIDSCQAHFPVHIAIVIDNEPHLICMCKTRLLFT